MPNLLIIWGLELAILSVHRGVHAGPVPLGERRELLAGALPLVVPANDDAGRSTMRWRNPKIYQTIREYPEGFVLGCVEADFWK